MNFFQTIAVAFAMFSAIPCPQPEWTEKNMRYSLCAFPLIGAVSGLLCWGWVALMGYVGGSVLLQAGGLCAIPVLVTGGIHLDGYADTSDALGSYGSPEKKREIILMLYFLDMTEKEIAVCLKLVQSTVHYHKDDSLRLLRKLME